MMKTLKKDLKLKDLDDIYLSIGTLRYTAGFIITLTTDNKALVEDALIEKVNNRPQTIGNYKNDIIVAGIGDILVNLAKCCKPVKGDDITGFITKGQGITIHRKNCPNILDQKDRLIDVSWNYQNDSTYTTDLYIETDNNKNYLSDIIATFTKRNVHIDSFKAKEYTNYYIYEVTIKVKNKEEVERIILDFEMLSFVGSVSREYL